MCYLSKLVLYGCFPNNHLFNINLDCLLLADETKRLPNASTHQNNTKKETESYFQARNAT